MLIKDAVAVVIKDGNRFLLIKRAKKGMAEDYWCPVTGAIESGEDQRDAVRRETREELGLEVDPLEKVWECLTEDGGYRLHWWFARLLNDRITADPAEVKAYAWLTAEEMEKLEKMFPADLRFFKEIGPILEDRKTPQ